MFNQLALSLRSPMINVVVVFILLDAFLVAISNLLATVFVLNTFSTKSQLVLPNTCYYYVLATNLLGGKKQDPSSNFHPSPYSNNITSPIYEQQL